VQEPGAVTGDEEEQADSENQSIQSEGVISKDSASPLQTGLDGTQNKQERIIQPSSIMPKHEWTTNAELSIPQQIRAS
jgi:hypothetical protein